MAMANYMTKTIFILLALLLGGKSSLAQVSGSPMACTFKGKIVCVYKERSTDEKSLCAKYPCKARVEILEVKRCGSSVTRRLNIGDTVDMHFAYTLHRTKKILPKMKEHYPGLRRKKVFTADAVQQIVPGGAANYTVYDYSKN